MTTLHIRQRTQQNNEHCITLTLKRMGNADLEAEATVRFALSHQEQEDLRWYLEDYLELADTVEPVVPQQVEYLIKTRGEELYTKVLEANTDTRAMWFSIRNDLADLRVEISAGIVEAASIPWELMRDPVLDSPISLRAKSFVRVQSTPSLSFVRIPSSKEGRIRLLYIISRPNGPQDPELRAVANRLLQGLGPNGSRFDIKVLRPPTFEELQTELTDAKEAGWPYHIVHFDGHGCYGRLLEGVSSSKQGFLIFEQPSSLGNMRFVDGQTFGQLLHDCGVPILVLNACQTAMHAATSASVSVTDVHSEIRAIGSLAQAVIDQGIPAVLAMRYSIFVVTAAQYIGELYSALAKNRSFGQAATEARKHLHLNPDRWVALEPRSLQDWIVPIVYEAKPLELFSSGQSSEYSNLLESDPVQINPALIRYIPNQGFIGRDETLLALDRAFDENRIVLLYAYAGQGKTSTAVEFVRWYSSTGGLGEQPRVILTSFGLHIDLNDLLNQIAQLFAPILIPEGIFWSALSDKNRRLEEVKKLLRKVPIFWIWDNVETVAGFPEGTESPWTSLEQAELADFLKQIKFDHSSKAKVILTSRRDEQRWLEAIPYRILMPRMRKTDAARLLLELGKERRITLSEIADWQPLLDYCSGNPLTLNVLIGQVVKMGLRGNVQIGSFVDALKNGEEQIEDIDEKQGRDKSLGASLSYGFSNAFTTKELSIIALLHFFQGAVGVTTLHWMGNGSDFSLPELNKQTEMDLNALLERAKDIGFLTQIGHYYFSIHPALPWFLCQNFTRYYDGENGHSMAETALFAWVNAVGKLGNYCFWQYNMQDRSVIRVLKIEESNLLHARRIALRQHWLAQVICCMQGLTTLYEYQGRIPEYAKLVAEILPYCNTFNNEPIPGCEEEWIVAMGYCIWLAHVYERDLTKAVDLHSKLEKHCRERAAGVLALPESSVLDNDQRSQLRTIGVAKVGLGKILCERGEPTCIQYFQDAIAIYRRIQDRPEEAATEYQQGIAYTNIPEIRDLNAVEDAYKRSLNLRVPTDTLGRAITIKQIGMVYSERCKDALKRNEPIERFIAHARAALDHSLEGIRLCPGDAFFDLAPMHSHLGYVYSLLGQIENARNHLELSVQYFEKIGDRHGSGEARVSLAVNYFNAANHMTNPSSKGDNLIRAQNYVKSAMRDFQHYQVRDAARENKVQELLDKINRQLEELQD